MRPVYAIIPKHLHNKVRKHTRCVSENVFMLTAALCCKHDDDVTSAYDVLYEEIQPDSMALMSYVILAATALHEAVPDAGESFDWISTTSSFVAEFYVASREFGGELSYAKLVELGRRAVHENKYKYKYKGEHNGL